MKTQPDLSVLVNSPVKVKDVVKVKPLYITRILPDGSECIEVQSAFEQRKNKFQRNPNK